MMTSSPVRQSGKGSTAVYLIQSQAHSAMATAIWRGSKLRMANILPEIQTLLVKCAPFADGLL